MTHPFHTQALKRLSARRPRLRKSVFLGLAVLAAFSVIAAGCGDDDNPTTTEAPTTAGGDAMSLGEVCPATIKVQTDWFPEPEHNYLYQLVGVNGTIDKDKGSYSGPIGDGSVELVVQAGGPYRELTSQTAQFYGDDSIYMAFVDTSEAIKAHANTPVVAVFTNFEVGPQILMWDPAEYDFETFDDIGNSDATVLYFAGASYMDYLVHEGILDESQIDSTYDGSPARFTTEDNIVQQGFATNEPYRYENEIEAWKKPVGSLLIHDSGHNIYQSALSVKPETIKNDADCLKQLVPMFQKALVDYMNDPEPLNVRLDEIVTELDSFWTSSVEGHNAATKAMRERGMTTDGDNGYVGDMDKDRIQGLIDKLGPVYGADGAEGFGSDGSTDLTAEDIFTNEFLDTSISLGF